MTLVIVNSCHCVASSVRFLNFYTMEQTSLFLLLFFCFTLSHSHATNQEQKLPHYERKVLKKLKQLVQLQETQYQAVYNHISNHNNSEELCSRRILPAVSPRFAIVFPLVLSVTWCQKRTVILRHEKQLPFPDRITKVCNAQCTCTLYVMATQFVNLYAL